MKEQQWQGNHIYHDLRENNKHVRKTKGSSSNNKTLYQEFKATTKGGTIRISLTLKKSLEIIFINL